MTATSFIGAVVSAPFLAYWLAQLVFVHRYRRRSRLPMTSDVRDAGTPLSVIHPIRGLDFAASDNVASWLDQNYQGPVEHIFSFQAADDPALPVVRAVLAGRPDVDAKVIVNPVLEGTTGKSSNMLHGARVARYETLVFVDSDVRASRDVLTKLVRPLRDPRVGAVTCAPTNLGGSGFWTRFFTFIQNSESAFIWAFLTWLGLDMGLTGTCFATTRTRLEDTGGLGRWAGSALEDYFLGKAMTEHGYRLALGPFVECPVGTFQREKATNYMAKIALGLRVDSMLLPPAFAIVLAWYWLLGCAAILTGSQALLMLAAVSLGVRVLQGALMRLVIGDRVRAIDLLLGPLFDLSGTAYLLLAMVRTPDITWRGTRYHVGSDGFVVDPRLKEPRRATS